MKTEQEYHTTRRRFKFSVVIAIGLFLTLYFFDQVEVVDLALWPKTHNSLRYWPKVNKNTVITTKDRTSSTQSFAAKDTLLPSNSNATYVANQRLPISDDPSQPKLCIPSFLVNGVQKGGTTELSLWLKDHPNVMRYRTYETHFWDCIGTSKGRFRGNCLKKQWKQKSVQEALPLYSSDSPRLPSNDSTTQCFEKSPSYFDMVDPNVIKKHVPGTKILSAIRNPTDRLYSSYWHSCKRKLRGSQYFFISSCSTEDFMRKIQNLASDFKSRNEDCVSWRPDSNTTATGFERMFNNGRYFEYAANWFKAFGSDYHISHFEDFVQDPFAVMNDIQSFLGLPEFDYHTVTRKDYRGYWVLDWENAVTRSSFASASRGKHAYPKLTLEQRQYVDSVYKPCVLASCELFQKLTPRMPQYLEQVCQST